LILDLVTAIYTATFVLIYIATIIVIHKNSIITVTDRFTAIIIMAYGFIINIYRMSITVLIGNLFV